MPSWKEMSENPSPQPLPPVIRPYQAHDFRRRRFFRGRPLRSLQPCGRRVETGNYNFCNTSGCGSKFLFANKEEGGAVVAVQPREGSRVPAIPLEFLGFSFCDKSDLGPGYRLCSRFDLNSNRAGPLGQVFRQTSPLTSPNNPLAAKTSSFPAARSRRQLR